MGESSKAVDQLRYLYFTEENEAVPNGPKCHICMNEAFRSHQLDRIERVSVKGEKGLVSFTIESLVFQNGMDTPFSLKYICGRPVTTECVNCPRRSDVPLTGNHNTSGNVQEFSQENSQANKSVETGGIESTPVIVTNDANVEYELSESSSSNMMSGCDVETVQSHSPSKTQGVEKRHKCEFCDKDYSQPYELQVHLRYHSANHRYRCQICGNPFHLKRDCESHQSTHTTDSTFKCYKCHRIFLSSEPLLLHCTTIHDADLLFYCLLCSRPFDTEAKRDKHSKLHTDERPHACPICAKTFRKKKDVKKHMKTHEEKRISCSLCGMMFNQKHIYGATKLLFTRSN